jgi:hypothetical protein
MTDRSILLRTFNTHFFEFLDDVIRIFPDNVDIQVAKTSFQTIKKSNPTLIIKAWYNYIYLPYSSIIEEGDISFFFEKDYSQDLSILNNSNTIIEIIDTLRGPIREMTSTQKDFTMKYLQNLSKISMLYSS